jgi:hypothetical protein
MARPFSRTATEFCAHIGATRRSERSRKPLAAARKTIESDMAIFLADTVLAEAGKL